MYSILSNEKEVGENIREVTYNEDYKETDLLIATENSLEEFKKVNKFKF